MKNDNNLFYTCSLIEYIGRKTKNKRKDLIMHMRPDIRRIYSHADVFHCEPIEKVADDFIQRCQIPTGNYDVEEGARYEIPDYWDIGEVFERLVEDVSGDRIDSDIIAEVFLSWLAEKILIFNSDLYYQPREYIAECYRAGKIIEDQ